MALTIFLTQNIRADTHTDTYTKSYTRLGKIFQKFGRKKGSETSYLAR